METEEIKVEATKLMRMEEQGRLVGWLRTYPGVCRRMPTVDECIERFPILDRFQADEAIRQVREEGAQALKAAAEVGQRREERLTIAAAQSIAKERHHEAIQKIDSIKSQAARESRSLTRWEEGRVEDLKLTALKAELRADIFRDLADLREKAQHQPLNSAEVFRLRLFGKNIPEAMEVVRTCRRKEKKPFAKIVKDTPRLVGERPEQWIRRIWSECDKYETRIPAGIEYEKLEQLSRSRSKRLKKAGLDLSAMYPNGRALQLPQKPNPSTK